MEGNQPIITKYKKLTQSFLKDNPYVDDKNAAQNPNKTIYTTKDKKDYETKKLEKQQTKYLSGQWQKVKTHIQEKSLLYETQRYPAYLDYDLMEYYPIIGQALDILMEESTTVNAEGKILNIFSESKRVQDELKELFYNRLNIHTTLPMWIRNLPVRKNSMIPLLDGSTISIEDLSQKVKSGEEIWTYSVQEGTNDIVPSKIVWCDLTRKNSKIYRVTFDDGTYTDTTPDHQYMMRNGSYKAAEKLNVGDSLMPFYTKKSEKKKHCLEGYEKVLNPKTNKFKFTHRVVSCNLLRNEILESSYNEVIHTHHIDFNKLNNSPSNLERLTASQHRLLHKNILEKTLMRPDVIKKRMDGIDRYLRSNERRIRMSEKMKGIYPDYFKQYNNSELHNYHNIKRTNVMTDLWSSPEYKDKLKSLMKYNFSEECKNIFNEAILQKYGECYNKKELSKILLSNVKFVDSFEKCNTHLKRNSVKGINAKTINDICLREFGLNTIDYMSSINPEIKNNKKFQKAQSISNGKIINHKVVSVVELDELDDVYCMEVLGPNGEHDRHNFAICSRDEHGNYSRNGVFVSNCKYGDNFVYLQIDDEMGIVGTRQLANIEVERVEGTANTRGKPLLKNDDDEVIFRWKSTDIAEFKYWQIAHFRLLVDDRRLPYGVSVLEKARRIWKNLLLVEDAMRTIRLLRAIDRRVYYVNVGNIDPNDVQAYIEDIASRFKRKRHIDEYTGQEDLKYNVMGYDQDYFIPIRDANEGTKIETLAGASNIDQIADIEYDLNQLFAALGIPKPFLQYDAAAGEGKNLAMADVRFARKINRIQQAALQELNKIAMVHLTLLGLDDELHNFELSLNNPSVQAEVMRTEQFAAKINSFKDAVADASNGISALSVTMAMKRILGMTDDEVKLNLEQQFMERVAAEELKTAATKVKSSTLFDGILKLYGIEATGEAPAAPTGETVSSDMGGGGGGGGNFTPTGALEMGGGGADMGGGAEATAPEATAPEATAPEATAPEAPPAEEAAPEATAESFVNHKKDKLIMESDDELERILEIMKKMK
jgi:hypothetical protein